MAVRNAQIIKGTIKTYKHASMPTFAKGDRVKFGAADQLLAAVTGPDVDSFGYVYQQRGTEVDVLLDGHSVIEVTVGSGQTATRGKLAVMHSTANTYKDATTPGGGSTAQVIAGRFLTSGTAGQKVEMMVGGINPATVIA